jgi:hypothetical protein
VYSPTGGSTIDVPTARGTFTTQLIKERLADVTVRTVTANAADCFDQCPVKPLAQYVSENGAYAGIHGTYLCPPDYASCAGKVNSYEYAVYNSVLGRWLNPRAFVNPVNALVAFNGKTPTYYRHIQTFDSSTSVTAAISNFPLLLQGGTVVDTEAEQTDAQRQRGAKGSIGTDGTYIYLAIVSNATVTESAFVLQALGVKDAMNLDGGGTSALWIGGQYLMGPGRLLPNAVLLMKP